MITEIGLVPSILFSGQLPGSPVTVDTRHGAARLEKSAGYFEKSKNKALFLSDMLTGKTTKRHNPKQITLMDRGSLAWESSLPLRPNLSMSPARLKLAWGTKYHPAGSRRPHTPSPNTVHLGDLFVVSLSKREDTQNGAENCRASQGSRITDYISVGVISKTFPLEKVNRILQGTGKISQRQRDLPAHVVVYYVLALALFMQVSYREVLRCLLEGIEWLSVPGTRIKITGKSGISQARTRLGSGPLKELHDALVKPIAGRGTRGAWYRRWHL